MFGYLLRGITLGFAAAVSPGPFQAYLLNRTLSRGWRRTLLSCLAPLLSDGPIILLVVVLLAHIPEWFLNGLKLAGSAYLLFLAYQAFKAFRSYEFQPDAFAAPARRSLLEAALINASGPGPYIFYSLIAGPLLIEGWRINPLYGAGFLLGFYTTLIGGFAAFVLLFALARHLGPIVNRALIGLSALGLLFFGLSLLYQGVAILWR